jgi:hypothetical protein
MRAAASVWHDEQSGDCAVALVGDWAESSNARATAAITMSMDRINLFFWIILHSPQIERVTNQTVQGSILIIQFFLLLQGT